MADTATFSAAMKTKFIGPIRDTLPRGKVLLFGDPDANPTDFRGILPTAENIDFVGNEFRMPWKAIRNQSVGFRLENETLPAPGSSEYTYLTEPLRFAYALFNITGQLLKASESNEGAFVSAFKQEMEDTILSSKLDFNRAAYGDGTGKMATIAVGAAGNVTQTVDTTINFRALGEVVDIVSAAGVYNNAANAGRVVTGLSRTGLTLTFDSAVTPANGDIIVRASRDSTSTVPNNSLNKEINGLAGIVSATGVLHGLNPNTYRLWQSYVQAVNGPISDDVMRDAKDTVGFEQGLDLESGLDFALITTRGVRRRYADTLTALKRFSNAEAVKLHGGFTALMFDENPIFVDDQCPSGNMWGLALNRMFWSQMSDWDWMEEDGKVLKWEPRRDRYIGILYKYCQLGTWQRGAHFRLTGLTDVAR